MRGLRGSARDRSEHLEDTERAQRGGHAAFLRMGVLAECDAHEIDEARATVDVVGELVETRAGRREHDRVARPGEGDGARATAAQRAHPLDGHLRSGERALTVFAVIFVNYDYPMNMVWHDNKFIHITPT